MQRPADDSRTSLAAALHQVCQPAARSSDPASSTTSTLVSPVSTSATDPSPAPPQSFACSHPPLFACPRAPAPGPSVSSYPQDLLQTLTSSLRQGHLENPSRVAHEVNLTFIALCHFNMLHLVPDEEREAIQTSLATRSGCDLISLARSIQLVLSRGGRPRCTNDTPQSGSASIASPTSHTYRSQAQVRRALKRDKNTCIVTGEEMDWNEVAHIIPYSVGSQGTWEVTKPDLFQFLRYFAGTTVLRNLEAYLLAPVPNRNGTLVTQINRLENLLTLSPTVHRMWANCCFTLTPIGDPLASSMGTVVSYSCVFEWLPRHKHLDHPDLTQVQLVEGVQMTEEQDQQVSAFLFDRRTNTRIVSGHVIELRTKDPYKYPLPHPDLLRLYSAIARVVRCAGQSGPRQGDDYLDDFDEEFLEDEVVPGTDLVPDVEPTMTSLQDEEPHPVDKIIPEELRGNALNRVQAPTTPATSRRQITDWLARSTQSKPISYTLRKFLMEDTNPVSLLGTSARSS